MSLRALRWAFVGALGACGAAPDPGPGDAAVTCAYADAAAREDGRVIGGPFATRVVSFTPGEGATFGHARLPDVVLGPPQGGGENTGTTDVVSLGLGGEIVLGFDRVIVDGPGDDFTVFENAFSVPGATLRHWTELAEVSVSVDGQNWVSFQCDTASSWPHPGCAGARPVYASTASGFCALDPRVSGGDGFDLATLGLREARFVRLRDLGTQGLMAPATGFDLDAVAVLNGR